MTDDAEERSLNDAFTARLLEEWRSHEFAPRIPCPECHFELADCCDRHRHSHAPWCPLDEES